MKIRSRSEEQTRRLGRALGRRLRGGDLLCLKGPLGSGKTTLVQGLAEGIGYRGRPSSPSFVLVREYRVVPGRRAAGRRTARVSRGVRCLYHVDLYRLEAGEPGGLGLEELFSDPASACAIEWPEALRELPRDRLEISFSHRSGTVRLVEPVALGPLSRRLLSAFRK